MFWCGNSPDHNAIEPCWFWMKQKTKKKGAPTSRVEAIFRCGHCWTEELDQERIKAWIEQIPVHGAQVIKLEAGNEYKEEKEHLRRAH
jgi:hypothetical protein